MARNAKLRQHQGSANCGRSGFFSHLRCHPGDTNHRHDGARRMFVPLLTRGRSHASQRNSKVFQR